LAPLYKNEPFLTNASLKTNDTSRETSLNLLLICSVLGNKKKELIGYKEAGKLKQ